MAPSSASRAASPDPRLSFQESMELADLPPSADGSVRRYMSRMPAWQPGEDVPDILRFCGEGKAVRMIPMAAFGGHVYAQAGLAACRAVGEEERKGNLGEGTAKLGLHTVHGYFCLIGFVDRPFIYEVTVISTQRSFVTGLVNVRQSFDRSTKPEGPFPLSDAEAELGPVCFTALVSFKLPERDSAGASTQEASAQTRFAEVLAQRPSPEDWTPAPPLDIDAVTAGAGRDIVGTFPGVHMLKVDMRAFNDAKPMHEKRELLLYRLLKPFPVGNAEDANAHALVHAYESDRNGLLMAGNFLGFGFGFKKVASLSNTFVVHTNVDAARMRHESETADGMPEWWIQEVSFPRAKAGRVAMECKIWSPDGTHVASVYQDGLCAGQEDLLRANREKGKL